MAIRLAVITASTRPGRRGKTLSDWTMKLAAQHPAVTASDVEVESIDLAEVNLPLLDEAMPPIVGQYANPHTKEWAAKIDTFDGFVFVVPEYNHSIPAPLKNAIDYLYAEWNDKAAGFVGYGPSGGLRAVEHLRQILSEVKVATIRDQVAINAHEHGELLYEGVWNPTTDTDEALNLVLDETIAWAEALKSARAKKLAATAA